ncbi:MAG: hypothetical protein ACK6DR_18670 [Gemmatimonas sp.]|uniref:hypothetical protein n=1 Tax=Gemmatimonas sp. TaxID=1962908 RepID=UPI00391AB447
MPTSPPRSGALTPADILANVDGVASLLQTCLGFWRFIFSPRYRATVLERWNKRQGFSRLATVAEVFGALLSGLILPAVFGYTLFVIATR